MFIIIIIVVLKVCYANVECAMIPCYSVHSSLRLSQAGVPSKLWMISSRKKCCIYGLWHSVVFCCQRSLLNFIGITPTGGAKYTWDRKSLWLLKNSLLYLKKTARDRCIVYISKKPSFRYAARWLVPACPSVRPSALSHAPGQTNVTDSPTDY